LHGNTELGLREPGLERGEGVEIIDALPRGLIAILKGAEVEVGERGACEWSVIEGLVVEGSPLAQSGLIRRCRQHGRGAFPNIR
jgi:hypothetical protein